MCDMSLTKKTSKLLHALRKSYDRRKIRKNGVIVKQPQIKTILSNKVPDCRVLWEDYEKYRLCDQATIEYVFKHSIVDDLQYESEFFDCENFGGLFRALTALQYHLNSVGRVLNYSGGHSFNFYITKQEELWLYEPQNGMKWVLEDNDSMDRRYKINGEILII